MSIKGIKNIWKKRKKSIILFGVLFTGLVLCSVEEVYLKKNEPDIVKYSEYESDLISGKIDTVYYDTAESYMRYTLINEDTKDMSRKERDKYDYDVSDWRMTLFPAGEDFRENILKYNTNLEYRNFEAKSVAIIRLVLLIGMPILVFVIALYFINRIMRGGNSKLLKREPEFSCYSFKDVIGHDEILKDLKFITSIIKNDSKAKLLDVHPPRGVLFTGSAGTGKTLVAKAIAGECGIPFFYLNGSSLIELYVGVGAKRIRDVFAEARKSAPCIVFIDELDAIGIARTSNPNSTENTQTLTALLQELDGFSTASNVFIIGATNTPEFLDKALVRSGRFDRQIVFTPPKDWTVRKDLFVHYLRGTPTNADLDSISKQCSGFTGADISAIVNEAKLIALAEDRDSVTTVDIEEAIDKKIFNGNKSTKEKHSKDKLIVAYHEAGHTVMTYLCNKPIARASIVGTTSGFGGFVMQTDEDTSLVTKTDLENQLKICYAGRCAEKLQFNEISIGASNDITQATNILNSYVGKYGFDASFGMLDISVLSLSPEAKGTYLELLSEKASVYEVRCLEDLKLNFALVDIIAKALLERETLSGADIEKLLENQLRVKVSNNKITEV